MITGTVVTNLDQNRMRRLHTKRHAPSLWRPYFRTLQGHLGRRRRAVHPRAMGQSPRGGRKPLRLWGLFEWAQVLYRPGVRLDECQDVSGRDDSQVLLL